MHKNGNDLHKSGTDYVAGTQLPSHSPIAHSLFLDQSLRGSGVQIAELWHLQ